MNFVIEFRLLIAQSIELLLMHGLAWRFFLDGLLVSINWINVELLYVISFFLLDFPLDELLCVSVSSVLAPIFIVYDLSRSYCKNSMLIFFTNICWGDTYSLLFLVIFLGIFYLVAMRRFSYYFKSILSFTWLGSGLISWSLYSFHLNYTYLSLEHAEF